MKNKNKLTQKQRILAFLQQGLKLNALIAQREFGCIGSTLAYHIHELRGEGWDIETKHKTSLYSGNRYAEYSLSPYWRLRSDRIRREEVQAKPLNVRQLRIGDRVVLAGGVKGKVTALYEGGLAIVLDKEAKEMLVPIISITKKLRD